MAIRQVPFRWSDEFVARIDAARGDVPRARFVQRCVEEQIGAEPVRERVGRLVDENREALREEER